MYEIPTPSEIVNYYRNDDHFLIKSYTDENLKSVFIINNRQTKQTFFTNDSTLFIAVCEVYFPEVFNELCPSKTLKFRSLSSVQYVQYVRKNAIVKKCLSFRSTNIHAEKFGVVRRSATVMGKLALHAGYTTIGRLKN